MFKAIINCPDYDHIGAINLTGVFGSDTANKWWFSSSNIIA